MPEDQAVFAADAKNLKVAQPKKPEPWGGDDLGKLSTPEKEQRRIKKDDGEGETIDTSSMSMMYVSFYSAGLDGMTKHRSIESIVAGIKSCLLKLRMELLEEPDLSTWDEMQGVQELPFGLRGDDGRELHPIKGQKVRLSYLKVAPDGYVASAFSSNEGVAAVSEPEEKE